MPICGLRGWHGNKRISQVTEMKSATASKIEHRREMRSIVKRVARKGLTDKVIFKQSLEGLGGTTCRYPEENNSRHREPHMPRTLATSLSGKLYEQ